MAKIDKVISKQLLAGGWRLHSTRNHEKWLCSCGEHGPVIKPKTMGRGRGANNFRSIMRKQGSCSVDIALG